MLAAARQTVKDARLARGGRWDQKTERCISCIHWTDRNSEFDGWQYCELRKVFQHRSGGCTLHAAKQKR